MDANIMMIWMMYMTILFGMFCLMAGCTPYGL